MISKEQAQEIAAQWHAPDNAFSWFSHKGIIVGDLAEEIAAEIRAIERLRESVPAPVTSDAGRDRTEAIASLRALDEHVRAQTVRTWSVGSNHAGYLPEGDVHTFIDYADAVDAYRAMVEAAPEELAGEECECDDTATCELCSLDAEVLAYLADEVPTVIGRKLFAAPRELSIALRPDSRPLPMVYWVQAGEATYGEYLMAREV